MASKYHNIQTIHNGIKYSSKAEAARAIELDLELRAGAIKGWARQVPFMLGTPKNTYRVDFLVFNNDRSVHAEDVKGYETAEFKRHARDWADYGLCPLKIIKMRGGKLVTERIVGVNCDG